MQFKWTDLTGADLDKIEAYIARENSPSVAVDVVLKVIDTAHLILPEHPGAGRLGRLKAHVNWCSTDCRLSWCTGTTPP